LGSIFAILVAFRQQFVTKCNKDRKNKKSALDALYLRHCTSKVQQGQQQKNKIFLQNAAKQCYNLFTAQAVQQHS
jgi:hypothetical protein